MRVRKASKGQIFRCSAGHHWPEALLIEGQEPSNLNGTYCLVCFGIRVVGRLAVPRADLVADPFEPTQAQAEPPAAEEGNPSQVTPGYTPEPSESVEMPPPNQPQEEAGERAEEVSKAQEADADSGEAEAESQPATGDAEGSGAGEESGTD
jgi:hypothetical protein